MLLATYRLNREQNSYVIGDTEEQIVTYLTSVVSEIVNEYGHDEILEDLAYGLSPVLYKIEPSDIDVSQLLLAIETKYEDQRQQAILQREESQRRREEEEFKRLKKKLGKE